MKHFSPPYSSAAQFEQQLREQGSAVMAPESLRHWLGCGEAELAALAPFWQQLPPDNYLRDGGRYRFRRHGSFVVDASAAAPVRQVEHRAHWQPLDYNALHGGLERWFEPMDEALLALPGWSRILEALAATASRLKGAQPWFVEAHQFRIDTADGIGRPTPEGAHRDGVDFVAVFLVQREGIKGGESRVFEAAGPRGQRFTMSEPWTLLLLDDERVIHETTPIQPVAEHGWRDTLVITLRRGSFQDPLPGDSSAA
ncbi:2OG-Fe dioxygenase family protein [Paucibacter sp. APW11]|uniref:2OG-Fe dioxygenase family protein n=1 Tax=Roseateles aquae TaxID=3077235 RepID=A0ABU3P8K3_9BURK|nr:2OG-Fe dioxygenase family protein [Paucibacter sp. APW11]MDT8998904.1 2OG-Fe dioxygenase family protein [Paucibacter sp. APW11]